jgi:hypothetical protein
MDVPHNSYMTLCIFSKDFKMLGDSLVTSKHVNKREKNMRLKVVMVDVSLALLIIISGCKPDKMEIEVYTSDIQKASSEGVVELPLTATFSMIGEDTEGVLPKAKAVAKRYLNDKAEFKFSKGDWGDVMVIKCTVPMGTAAALKTYLAKHHRPLALTIDKSTITLDKTEHLERLSQDLSGINMMLDADLPAKSTMIRFVGDLEKGPEIMAIAVFSDNKPELIFHQAVERRQNVEIDYRGGDGSVYSGLPPQFAFKL